MMRKVGKPVARMVADSSIFVGTTEPSRSLEVRAHVDGGLETAYFPEGRRVKEGELLFEIDRKGSRAALELADAGILKAEARLKLALASAAGLPRRQEADADLAIAKADLGVAEADRDRARRLLDSTRIRAPFDGEVSKSLVAPGDPVKASRTVLAKLEATDPLAVAFNVDEWTLLRLRRRAWAELTAVGLAVLPVRVGLSSKDGFPHPGKARLGSETMDLATGTARLRATIANPDHALLPGMTILVRLEVGEPREALLIPEAAVIADGGRKFLDVLDDQGRAERRPVTLGPPTVPGLHHPIHPLGAERAGRVEVGQGVHRRPPRRPARARSSDRGAIPSRSSVNGP